LLLADVDKFYAYNIRCRYLNRPGHETLRKVAQTIARTVHRGDRAFRCGGE
jgi:GGDEF domain-containing protein